MEIVEYSPKSFAVIGESTREYKEDIKALGGKYNRNLKCGPGYIFSISKKGVVEDFLNSICNEKEGNGENIDEENTKEEKEQTDIICGNNGTQGMEKGEYFQVEINDNVDKDLNKQIKGIICKKNLICKDIEDEYKRHSRIINSLISRLKNTDEQLDEIYKKIMHIEFENKE